MKIQIPKTIHYIWLGGNEKTELILRCIKSWSETNPDFEIIEWNEMNYDTTKHPQIKRALEAKNYAYASDIMRVDILNEYGGVYLDTDMELIKPLGKIINRDICLSYESKYWFGTAIIAGVRNHPMFEFILKRYDHEKEINFKTNYLTVHSFTAYMRYVYNFKPNNKLTAIDNIVLLPKDYFYPIDYMSFKKKITDNTIGIHHYGGSWHNLKQQKGYRFSSRVKKIIGAKLFLIFEKLFAYTTYRKLKKEFNQIRKDSNG